MLKDHDSRVLVRLLGYIYSTQLHSLDEVITFMRQNFAPASLSVSQKDLLRTSNKLRRGCSGFRKDSAYLCKWRFDIQTCALASYLMLELPETLHTEILAQIDSQKPHSNVSGFLDVIAIALEATPKSEHKFRKDLIERVTDQLTFPWEVSRLARMLSDPNDASELDIIRTKEAPSTVLMQILQENKINVWRLPKTGTLNIKAHTNKISREFESLKAKSQTCKTSWKLKNQRSQRLGNHAGSVRNAPYFFPTQSSSPESQVGAFSQVSA